MPQKFAKRREKGAVVLETALVLILFLVTVLSIVDVGQVIFFRQAVIHSVERGLRFAVVRPYDQAAIRNMVVYRTATPDQYSNPVAGLSPDMVQVALLDVDTTRERIQIQVTGYPLSFVNPLLPKKLVAAPIVGTLQYEVE
jgi:hypothetical protein